MSILKFSLPFLLPFIFGCAAIVGGDVADVEYNSKEHKLTSCSESNKKYHLKINTNDIMPTKNNDWASVISGLTLGIIPAYWTIDADTSYQLYDGDVIISQKEYDNRFHMMYGIPLLPFHYFSEKNKVDYQIWSNRFPLYSAIKWRTSIRALTDLPSYISKTDICIR